MADYSPRKWPKVPADPPLSSLFSRDAMDESVFRRHWLKAQLAQTESLQDASHRRQILNELLVYARASRMRHFRYWVAIMYVPSLLGLMGHGGALYLITRVEWVGYLALVPTLMFLWEVMAH